MRKSIFISSLVLLAAFNLSAVPADDDYYINPILAGDYADPTVLRVGEDYYMTHSSFTDVPGLQLWHSRNLVNWEPIGYALHKFVGDVWAPDLALYNGTFYIYFPVYVFNPDGSGRRTIMVVTAAKPEGPWTEPVDLGCEHIDPGHIADLQGNRYLYFSDGHMAPLTSDGQAFTGHVLQVYDGWVYPQEWLVECRCLESPKLFYRDGYYYLVSAEGGTAGPSTSHMVVVARSTSAIGPWENSPYNPVLRTQSRSEKWWSQGHGTIFEAADGTWWLMYHGYRNGYQNLGRHTLLVPITWTDDAWPVLPEGTDTAGPLPMPAGEVVTGRLELSDDFSTPDLGFQWRMLNPGDSIADYHPGSGVLRVRAKGETLNEASVLGCLTDCAAYTTEVELEVPDGAAAGLLLYYDRDHHLGITLQQGKLVTERNGETQERINFPHNRVRLRILNLHHDVAFYYKTDNEDWRKCKLSFEISSMNHNTYYGFRSIRIALYTLGSGEVTFRDFTYTPLE
jgi:xylan 1,4-beta-xylosidase